MPQLGAASCRSPGQGNRPTAGQRVGEDPRVPSGAFSPFSFPKTQAGTFQGFSEIPVISSCFSGLSRWVELEQLLWSWGCSCLIPGAWKALQESFPRFIVLLSPPVPTPQDKTKAWSWRAPAPL